MLTPHVRHRYFALFFGISFLVGSVIHALLILGVLTEQAPIVITLYFHSLVFFNVVAGIGILRQKKIGYVTGLVIALTQIPVHGYMMYLDSVQDYGSGVSVLERAFDVLFASAYILSYFFPWKLFSLKKSIR